MRILTLLAVMAITAGQVWADEPTYGKIHYTNGSTDGGSLCFSTTLEKTYNAQTDFNGSGVSSGNDRIYTYTVTGNILTDGKVYVRAVPSFGYTVTGMTITVEPSAPSSTAEAPRRGAPGVASTIPVTPVEGHSGVYTFPMPTDGTNVTVTASFPVSTPINVDYLDATGTKKTAQAYVLDGAELYLGESGQEFWYVCNSAIDYRTQLRLYGDTHIILADDATMTISAGTQHAIESTGALTIYGQGGASGKLIAEATSGEGIYSKGDITIISADVSVTSTSSYAVHVNPGNITITDSKVTVNGGLDGFVATNVSDNTTKGNITINGSQVTAIGGTHANDYGINAVGGDITIGWKNTTDFIKASCYFIEGSGNVKTADGKPFIAYTPAATANDSEKQAVLIQGNTTFNANAIAAIAGKVLRPATADDVTVSYMDWDANQKKLVSKNTVEDGIDANKIVYVLQGGGATTLPGGWYVAKGEVSYTGKLKFTGDAHLILADGCNMTIGTAANPINDNAVYSERDNANLAIYGQSEGEDMGVLTVTSNSNGIWVCGDYGNASITINGGKVTANGDAEGIVVGCESIAVATINGGQVTATGTHYGIDIGGETSACLTINGGQVIATGTDEYSSGISVENIILGWTNPKDYIYASKYGGTVKTAAGKRFIAYNITSENDISANCIIGSATDETTLNSDTRTAIAGKTLRPLAVEETANDGTKTTYPGYYVSDNTGLAFSGKDTNITEDNPKGADFTIDDIPYYIYKANDDVTLTTDKDYGQNGIEFDATPAIEDATTEAGNVVTTKTITNLAQDIAINSVKYYNTAVKYMDWDDTQKSLVSKNTADITPTAPKVYILTGGGETTLPGGWYVVNNWNNNDDTDGIDAYTSSLTLTGDTHLILADGAEMNVYGWYLYEYGESPITYKAAIYGKDYDLSIYGQGGKDSEGNSIEGKLIVKPSSPLESNWDVACLYIKDIFINGGIINVPVPFDKEGYENVVISGIKCNNSTIRGGHVEITPCDDDIKASESIIILGGQTETGRIHAGNNITLSLTDGSDYIKSNSYSATGSVKIPAGKALAYTDGTTTVLGNTAADYVFGSGTNATLASIAGQTLRVSKNMPVSAVNAQYAALYQEDGDWKVTDPAVKMYVPTGNIIKNGNAYEMELQEVTGGGIPNGMPVILGKEGGLSDIPVVGTSADEANTIETNYNNAESAIEQKHQQEQTEPVLTLIATNTTETLAQQIINAASPKDDHGNVIEETKVNPNDYVVLGIVNGKLTTLSANQTAVPSSTQPVVVISKFDLLQMIRGTYAATSSNAPSIVIDLGDVTGISDIKHETLKIKSDDAWYTMDGRKISCKPTQKGIYIFNGTKRVVK